MGYQRDMRLEKLAQRRLHSCEACTDIDCNGLSYMTHTCGQTLHRAPSGASEALICGSGPWNV